MEKVCFDKRSLAEVYTVLIMLEKEKLNKIPKEIIEGIKNNRDLEYEIDFDTIENNMLPDTQKILSTLYVYYLANPEERDTVFKMIELEKKKKYKNIDVFKFKGNQKTINEEKQKMVQYKENIILKIKNWFIKLFQKWI